MHKQTFPQTITAELNSGWRFRKAGEREWRPATVPGTVHTDLFNNKIIPDPFFGSNEQQLQWIDTCGWEYELWFDADTAFTAGRHCDLVFEGLDTYAKVFLNDSLVLTAGNMFRTWKVDCGKLLKKKNHLVVIFDSAVLRGKSAAAKNSVVLPGDEKVYTRKAQYQYGWDWGPRFTGCGIWRPVKFVVWKSLTMQDIQVRHEMKNDSVSDLTATVRVEADKASICYLKVLVEGERRDSFYFEPLITDPAGQSVTVKFSIGNPRLWSCNGSGQPHVYKISFRLMNPQMESESKEVIYGIRSIELVQDADSAGNSFYFRLNGRPVFMKGANWIPADHFLPRVTRDKYRELLTSAVAANMNMIRVWGGGVYEDDAFYELCDSLGIIVWQDFMFACAMYPGDQTFMENVKSEVTDNVSRLKNHPCIALWCGNNEVDEGWKNWGWQKQHGYTPEDSAAIWKNYLALFHQMIPGLLSELDPGRPYWPSSPSIGWGRVESLRSGDSHYWGVWWGKQPFEMYAVKTGRFMSEYGFQGMPSMKAIKSFTKSDERQLNSAAIKNHQKHPTGFETIDHYMSSWYKKPKDFESHAYISQLLQAEGMRLAIEAHRRAKPYCMGTLYWQLNDTWPVTSWSSIDHTGTWKALHYTVQQAYDKYMLSVVDTGGTFSVYAVSDDDLDQDVMVIIEAMDFSGKIIWNDWSEVKLTGEHAMKAFTKPLDEILLLCDPVKTVVHIQLSKKKRMLSELFYYFKKPIDLSLQKPKLKIEIALRSENFFVVELTAENLCKNIFLDTENHDAFFTENFFDMIPGQKKTVFCRTSMDEAVLRKSLTFLTVADTY